MSIQISNNFLVFTKKNYVQIIITNKGGFMSEDAAGFLHLKTNMPNHYLGNDKMKILNFFTFTDFVNLQDLPIDFRDTSNIVYTSMHFIH